MIGGTLSSFSLCDGPYSVRVVSDGLVLFLPEDLRERDSGYTALHAHGVTLGDARVLELLDEGRSFVHLFSWRQRTTASLSASVITLCIKAFASVLDYHP